MEASIGVAHGMGVFAGDEGAGLHGHIVPCPGLHGLERRIHGGDRVDPSLSVMGHVETMPPFIDGHLSGEFAVMDAPGRIVGLHPGRQGDEIGAPARLISQRP